MCACLIRSRERNESTSRAQTTLRSAAELRGQGEKEKGGRGKHRRQSNGRSERHLVPDVFLSRLIFFLCPAPRRNTVDGGRGSERIYSAATKLCTSVMY